MDIIPRFECSGLQRNENLFLQGCTNGILNIDSNENGSFHLSFVGLVEGSYDAFVRVHVIDRVDYLTRDYLEILKIYIQ